MVSGGSRPERNSGTFWLWAIAADGTLRRRALRDIFSHPEEKHGNMLLHPLIQQETQRQFQRATSPMCYGLCTLLVEKTGCQSQPHTGG